MYLHASSTSAYWEYWNNLDRYRNASADYPDRGNDYDNFPASFDKLTTSIIWGTGSSFSTWFSGKYAHILGIQGLPMNPLVLHVGQYPDYMQEYVELGLTESSNGKPSGLGNDEWRDIWWNLWAMTDADAAFADYQTMGSNYAPENGESKAHTYHWVKTWQKLGHLKTGTGALTANHPAAVAFSNNGTTTYIGYNYSSSELTVTFSDGQQLIVAPESFEVAVVEGEEDSETGSGGEESGGNTDPEPTDPTQMDLPLDFESDVVNYVLQDFGGSYSLLVGNPDGAGTVAMTTKPLGAALWAGTTMSTNAGLASAIPVTTTNSIMKVWVYSPDAGIPVRLKIEDHNDVTHTVETETLTTVASAWEELSFDFTNEAPGTEPLIHSDWVFDKASIFFNFGTDGDTAGEKVYYWDNVSFGN